jgi:RND family efflux transporter MFP subunit
LELAQAQLRQLREGSRKEDIAQARALVDQARARRDLMTAELHRAEFLKDTISAAEYDKAKAAKHEAIAYLEQMEQALHLAEEGPRESQLEIAQAEVDRATAVMAKAQYWFDHTLIKAPIDGTILQKSGELGEFVRPESLVQGLCIMADLHELEAEVDVQERDVGLIKVGQPCRITTDAHEGKVFEGAVARLLPVASRQRGAVAVRIAVRNPSDELLPEMNCRVVFLRSESSSKPTAPIRLPKLAIGTDGKDAFVFVLRDAVARKTPVQLGAANDNMVEIKDGLHPGDRVLIAPGVALRDGQQVSINSPPSDHP